MIKIQNLKLHCLVFSVSRQENGRLTCQKGSNHKVTNTFLVAIPLIRRIITITKKTRSDRYALWNVEDSGMAHPQLAVVLDISF